MARTNQPAKPNPFQLVELDLNNPAFLNSWFALEKDEKVRVLNSLEKISQLTWAQVYADGGLKWEAISSSPVPLPQGVAGVYSLRITLARRGVAYRDHQFMRLLWIAPDHDATYRGHKR